MNAAIRPAKLSGRVRAVPSKSDAHRALIAASLSPEPTELTLWESSQDIEATIRCLKSLGAAVERGRGTVTVYPRPLRGSGQAPLLDCGESGSTLRFLLPVAAAVSEHPRLTAHGGLLRRPVDALLGCMGEHGVSYSSKTLPLELSGCLLSGGYEIPGDVSSQYVSGLLMALPILSGDSELRLATPLQSKGYVEMTLDTLRRFQIEIYRTENGFLIPGGQRYRSPGKVAVEGDWSNAAFFLAAGAVSGPVTVTGLRMDSLQRDRELPGILRRFGADVSVCGDEVTVSPGPLRGIELDVRDIPDLVPALAVAAAFSQGKTVFSGAGRLRIKESDRLRSVSELIRGLGGRAEELPDALIIEGVGSLSGGKVSSFGDHRIAMAAAVAASACQGESIITGAMAVEKSYPAFFRDYQILGGIADVL